MSGGGGWPHPCFALAARGGTLKSHHSVGHRARKRVPERREILSWSGAPCPFLRWGRGNHVGRNFHQLCSPSGTVPFLSSRLNGVFGPKGSRSGFQFIRAGAVEKGGMFGQLPGFVVGGLTNKAHAAECLSPDFLKLCWLWSWFTIKVTCRPGIGKCAGVSPFIEKPKSSKIEIFLDFLTN
jgi:hypothetical protein